MIVPPVLLAFLARYGVYFALAAAAIGGYLWFVSHQREVGRQAEQNRVVREQTEARRDGDKAAADAGRTGTGSLLDQGRY